MSPIWDGQCDRLVDLYSHWLLKSSFVTLFMLCSSCFSISVACCSALSVVNEISNNVFKSNFGSCSNQHLSLFDVHLLITLSTINCRFGCLIFEITCMWSIFQSSNECWYCFVFHSMNVVKFVSFKCYIYFQFEISIKKIFCFLISFTFIIKCPVYFLQFFST